MNKKQIVNRIKDIGFIKRKRLQRSIPLEFPFLLNVELTNFCTEKCIWCPTKDMTRPKGHMTRALFRRIIDECAMYRLRRLYVHWMGEPIMHPHFIEYLEYAKKKNVADMIVVATNGVFLTREIMKELVRIKVDEIYLSIDAATEKTYRKLKHSDSFCTIQDNIYSAVAIKRNLKSKLPFIRLKFLETDFNIHEKEQFKKRWRGIVDDVFFEKDFNNWDGKNKRVNMVVKNTIAYKRIYGDIERRYPCDRLWYMMAINWDGKVSPCMADWDSKNIVGDLYERRIKHIWDSGLLLDYRKKHVEERFDELNLCKNCTRWGTRNMGDWILKHRRQALGM